MQLVSDHIQILKPGKSGSDAEIMAAPEVQDRFGVPPEHVIEVLALTGDKSDNVPGVPGVGDKTAIPLIQQYGNLEELYRNIDTIAQKGLREKLVTHREKAFLSRDLVTIHTDAPVDIDLDALSTLSSPGSPRERPRAQNHVILLPTRRHPPSRKRPHIQTSDQMITRIDVLPPLRSSKSSVHLWRRPAS
jgi:5'-3' exonuclease